MKRLISLVVTILTLGYSMVHADYVKLSDSGQDQDLLVKKIEDYVASGYEFTKPQDCGLRCAMRGQGVPTDNFAGVCLYKKETT